MGLQLSCSELMLLNLLRCSISGKDMDLTLFEGRTSAEWQECYILACTQGVRALTWDAIMTLPQELQPERVIKIKWALDVERVERQFDYYSKVANELREFYLSHNIDMVQMKGVGLATEYPIPKHREGGDIDIYTYSSDTAKLTNEQANELADKLMLGQGIAVTNDKTEKHSEFVYKGVMIENHKTFINVKEYKLAQQVEEILKKRLNPRKVILAEGCSVNIPSPQFNSLFVIFHAAQHYQCGLALHHLCDWAVLINKYGLGAIPDSIKGGFREFIYAMTALCNDYLGSEVYVESKGELTNNILNSMLHPRYKNQELPELGKFGVIVYKTKRFFYRNLRRNRVLNHNMGHAIFNSIVSHIKRPHTIFH